MSDGRRQQTRVAVVTGGTSGIGLAVVELLVRQGAFVHVVGRDAVRAAGLKERLLQYTALWGVHLGDIRAAEFRSEVIQQVAASHGHLDILVHSAGTLGCGNLHDETESSWNEVINTNLTAPVFLTQEALPLLSAGSNQSVIFVSSICGRRPSDSIAYSASKAGVDAAMVGLARQLAPLGIRVNSLAPGLVRSNLYISASRFRSDAEYEEWLNERTSRYPLGRIGFPEDVAKAAVFLCSNDASWITGSTLVVDGGRLSQP